MTIDFNDIERRMNSAIESFKHDLGGLRTGRASASLLDSVMVEAYGGVMPLAQVGSVSVPEARMINIQVWDKGMVKAVEKAITNAGLGLNPMADGQMVRVPIPELSGDRRKELVKIAGKYAEETRVAIRNVRRDGMDSIKKSEKDKAISEDDAKKHSEKVQTMTDDHIKKVDSLLVAKEKEITTV